MNADTDLSNSEPSSEIESGSGGEAIVKAKGFLQSNMDVSSDLKAGINANGWVKGYDKKFLAGTGKIQINGETVASQDLTDIQFDVSGRPPRGVFRGYNVAIEDREEYNFVFDPDQGGLTEKTNLFPPFTNNFEFGYGVLTGYVKDVDGNPVSNAEVKIKGTTLRATTDENGYYEFQTGGGDYTFTALKESKEDEVTITEFTESSQDYQFAGVKVKAEDLSGEPIPNVGIELGGKTKYSDDEGFVKFPEMPLFTDYVAEGLGVNVEADTLDEGELTERSLAKAPKTGLATVKGQIRNTKNQPINNLEVEVEESGGSMFSYEDGQYRMLMPTGEITVRFKGGFRFATKEKVFTVEDGEIVEYDLELEDKTITSNY